MCVRGVIFMLSYIVDVACSKCVPKCTEHVAWCNPKKTDLEKTSSMQSAKTLQPRCCLERAGHAVEICKVLYKPQNVAIRCIKSCCTAQWWKSYRTGCGQSTFDQVKIIDWLSNPSNQFKKYINYNYHLKYYGQLWTITCAHIHTYIYIYIQYTH